MARKHTDDTPQLGRLRRAANAVKRLFGRGADEVESTETMSTAASDSPRTNMSSNRGTAPKPGRITRREADIPLDVLGRTYTPPFTGGKAGFRSDGSDHQNDQEFAYGVADERWNDEDRFTNKSGDPRIGTHRRTYEPGESRSESHD